MKTIKAIISALLVLCIMALLSSSCSKRMYRSSEENYDDVYMNENVEEEPRPSSYVRSRPSSQGSTKVSAEYRSGTPRVVMVKRGQTRRVK